MHLVDDGFTSIVGVVLEAIASINPSYLAVSIALYYVVALLYALRFYILLRSAGVAVGLFDAFAANMVGTAIDNLVPSFRVGGEAGRIAYIYLRRGRLLGVVAAAVLDKVVDVAGLTPVLVVALFSGAGGSSYWVAAGAAVFLGAGLLAARYWGRITAWAVGVVRRRGYALEVSEADLEVMSRLTGNRYVVAAALALSAAGWLVATARMQVVVASVGYSIGFSDAASIVLVYLAASLVAVTPGSIGFIEGSLTASLTARGLPAEKALAAVAVERLSSYLLATLTGVALGAGAGVWEFVKAKALRRSLVG